MMPCPLHTLYTPEYFVKRSTYAFEINVVRSMILSRRSARLWLHSFFVVDSAELFKKRVQVAGAPDVQMATIVTWSIASATVGSTEFCKLCNAFLH